MEHRLHVRLSTPRILLAAAIAVLLWGMCCMPAFAGEAKQQAKPDATQDAVLTQSAQGSTFDVQAQDELKTPKLSGTAHVENVGDTKARSADGVLTLGSTGKGRRLEAITIKTDDPKVTLEYKSHVENIGWEKDYTKKKSGTSGRALRVEAVSIRLAGDADENYDVHYRAHVQNIGWMNWAKNGEKVGSAGHALRMEALQVTITRKGLAAPTPNPPNDTKKAYECSRVSIDTHVENIGWQNSTPEGNVAGTTGRSLRLEALRMNVQNLDCPGGIQYKAHVQNIGWQGWKKNGALAGTTGRGLRLEALEVKLTGDAAKQFDVYYRVHAQNYGWMGWAKNGERAGTAAGSLRLEGIQVRLVNKDGKAPGSTELPYVDPTALMLNCSAWTGTSREPVTKAAGEVVGTVGKSTPITAIALEHASGMPTTVSYTTHLGQVGWTPEVSDGAISGQKSTAKSVQAMSVKLGGEGAKYFDVYYRAHVKNIGWMGWSSNGANSGTTGMNLPIEAYQVKVVLKGAPAPGSTSRNFIDGERINRIRARLNISTNYHNDQFVHGNKPAEYQKYIVLHDTEGGGDGNNVIDWWAGNGNMVAAHFVVNRDGSIVQAVDMDKIAHHAGYGNNGHNAYYGISEDGRDDMRGTQSIGSDCSDYGMNAWSIGIEMVHVGEQEYPESQLRALDGLIALIDATFGNESTIIQHSDWRNGNSDCSGAFQGYLRNYQRTRTHDGSTYTP